jgi:hypothetical protein
MMNFFFADGVQTADPPVESGRHEKLAAPVRLQFGWKMLVVCAVT